MATSKSKGSKGKLLRKPGKESGEESGKSGKKPPGLRIRLDSRSVDLEDSGVHLDEPLTPLTPLTPRQYEQLASERHSHSPKPFTRSNVTPDSAHFSGGRSPSRTPDTTSAAAVSAAAKFTFGSDSDSGEGAGKKGSPAGRRASAIGRESPGGQSPGVGQGRKERGKARFKKILRPLRRSQSAGCAKDVPAHALFLRHQIEKTQTSTERRGRAGMEAATAVSSDSESEGGDRKPAAKPKKEKKSLAKDVKEKFAFLRRRHTDSNLSAKDGKGAKPSVDALLSWSKTFDTLLSDKVGLDLFREFLQTEFSEENIEFWIACEDYKSVKEQKLVARAQEIYTDFVAVQAPREINLDSKTRLLTAENMSSPNRHTFEVAQKRIQALMEKDSYRRFLHSELYLSLLGDHRHKLNLT